MIEKVVKPGGDSGRMYVPKEWVDKRVKIILIELLMEPTNVDGENSERY